MTKVFNEDDLSDAVKNGESTIEIEGDLASKVIRIRATGTVAWIIAGGAFAVAVAVIATIAAIPTGGTSEAVAFCAAPAAVSILGLSTTYTAIAIAIAAGGVGTLSTLRNQYEEVDRGVGYLKLIKRH